MEFLESTYSVPTLILLGILLGALLVVRMMSQTERRMLSGTALFLAGLFFVGRHPEDGIVSLVGAVLWAVGLAVVVNAVVSWHRESKAMSAWAALLVLPIAFFGAILAGGVLITLFAGPAEAAISLVAR